MRTGHCTAPFGSWPSSRASRSERLRSRCQRIEIARPDGAVALQWLHGALGNPAPERLLELAGGAPLKALELAPHFDDLERQMSGLLEALLTERIEVTRAAAEMQGAGLPSRLDWLENWLAEAIRRGTVADHEKPLTLRGASLLQRAAAELNITAAFQVLDRLREARLLLEGNAAAPLVVETVLFEWRAAVRPR